MKVLHVIDSGGWYGAEAMLLHLAKQQMKMGINPLIASIGTPHDKTKPLEIEAFRRGIPCKKFRMMPGLNLLGTWKIVRFANENHFDLFHSHGYKGNIMLGLVPVAVRKKPIVTTLHGWVTSAGCFSKMRFYEWMDARVLKLMDGVVLVSKSMSSHPDIVKRITQRKLFVVNNGIELRPQANNHHELLHYVPEAKVKIVGVGRLSPEKGFDILIRAVSDVCKKGLDVSLVIFGEGGERAKLESLIARNNMEKRIKMPGFKPTPFSVFSCVDILIMPSLTEGLPITLLEAMRARLPVIASKVGGIPSLITDGRNGRLVNAGDVVSLSNAIVELSTSPELRRCFGERSYQRFIEKYLVNHMASSYGRIYSKILNKNSYA